MIMKSLNSIEHQNNDCHYRNMGQSMTYNYIFHNCKEANGHTETIIHTSVCVQSGHYTWSLWILRVYYSKMKQTPDMLVLVRTYKC